MPRSLAWMSLTHKKCKQSLPYACTLMFRKSFSISPTNTTGCSLNLISMSNIKGIRGGPTCKQSLGEVCVFLSLHDALYGPWWSLHSHI